VDDAGSFPGGITSPASATRIAIVGAGPAGCLLALALLDAARARRRQLSVTVYGAALRLRDPRPIVADADAILRLGAAGLTVPAPRGAELRHVRCHVGRTSFDSPLPLFVLPRAELVGGMRATAMARGARMMPRHVDEIALASDGTWTLRSMGASEWADRVVLACGAGAPIAAAASAHTPPPVWRGCLAELELDPDLEARLGGVLHWIAGERGLPHLQVIPCGRRAHAIALGEDVSGERMALALCHASRDGPLRGGFRLLGVERLLLPAGCATPGLPAVGAALGGAPGWTLLATAAIQAQTFAAAVVDEGTGKLLGASRAEARRIGRLVRAPRMTRSPLMEFGDRAVRRALTRAHPAEVPAAHPVTAAVAAAADPRPAGGSLRLAQRWRAFVLLLFAWLLAAASALTRRRRRAEGRPAARMVYVVDDDPDHASLLAAFLESRRIACRTFDDGLAAVAAAARERPVAAVIDLGLPWLDGRQIGGILERISGATVLLATALPASLARSPGGDRYEVLTKPLDLERLEDRLRACLPRAPADPEHRRRSG